MKLLETTLPFAGFYESIHSEQIDHEITAAFDLDGDGEIDLTEEKAKDFWWECSPRHWGVEQAYCKEYVEFIAETFNVKLIFETIVSPKEYNFTTDRIFAKIAFSEVERLYHETKKEHLAELIEEKFTSRDGFRSFYSNNLDEWLEKPLKNWDHNEIGTLLEAYIKMKSNPDLSVYENTDLAFVTESDTDFYSLVSEKIPQEIWDRYYPKPSGEA